MAAIMKASLAGRQDGLRCLAAGPELRRNRVDSCRGVD